MAQKLKILMIDDHPIILEGYKKILLDSRAETFELNIETAYDCDQAISKIESSLKAGKYDIVFLDISLPASKGGKHLSGEDLGREIRGLSPSTKLAVLTMHVENLRLLTILKTLYPEAFMIKSDVSSVEFLQAFDNIMEEKTYNSQTIQDLMRKQLISDYDVTKTDREILYYLSQGYKSKDIPDVVPTSLASVEKRKRYLRTIFEVEDTRDITLINKAKELGFI